MIRLQDDREYDPEEEELRRLKNLEHQRLEEQRLQAAQAALRQAEEAEATAEVSCHDEAAAKQRLKIMMRSEQASQVQFRVEGDSRADTDYSVRAKTTDIGPPSRRRRPRATGQSFGSGPRDNFGSAESTAEWFQPLEGAQPSLLQSMELAPGVSLVDSNSGKGKASNQVAQRHGKQMTRQEYISGTMPSREQQPALDGSSSDSCLPLASTGGSVAVASSLASSPGSSTGAAVACKLRPRTPTKKSEQMLGEGSHQSSLASSPGSMSQIPAGLRESRPLSPKSRTLQQFQRPGPRAFQRPPAPVGSTRSLAPAATQLQDSSGIAAVRPSVRVPKAGGTIVANRELLQSLFGNQ